MNVFAQMAGMIAQPGLPEEAGDNYRLIGLCIFLALCAVMALLTVLRDRREEKRYQAERAKYPVWKVKWKNDK